MGMIASSTTSANGATRVMTCCRKNNLTCSSDSCVSKRIPSGETAKLVSGVMMVCRSEGVDIDRKRSLGFDAEGDENTVGIKEYCTPRGYFFSMLNNGPTI